MKVERYMTGELAENSYTVVDDFSDACAVIDPGFPMEAELSGKNVKVILLTHGHFDHIAGAEEIRRRTGARIYIYEDDFSFTEREELNMGILMPQYRVSPFVCDEKLRDGDTVEVGSIRFSVLHTPGHTAGSCCFHAQDALFTGDTLLRGTIGRTDFPTGDRLSIYDSCRRLGELPGNDTIWPGHGDPSDMEHERTYNMYMRRLSR